MEGIEGELNIFITSAVDESERLAFTYEFI
jgi:hypothetical protein